MDTLEFDFHVAKEQEEKIRETGRKLEYLMREDYADCVAEVRQAWEGNESARFVVKMQKQSEKIRQTSAVMKRAAEALHEASIEAAATEEKVKEIAENRRYE